tara:strand:+ start:1890 stop:2978 length:1089 start_codon:yes stop_codon:yes gene_type:complete
MSNYASLSNYGEYVHYFALFMTFGLFSRSGFDVMIQRDNDGKGVFSQVVLVTSLNIIIIFLIFSIIQNKLELLFLFSLLLFNFFHLFNFFLRSINKGAKSIILYDILWSFSFILILLFFGLEYSFTDLKLALFINCLIMFILTLFLYPSIFKKELSMSSLKLNKIYAQVYSKNNLKYIILSLLSILIAWGDQLVVEYFLGVNILAQYFILLKFGSLMLIPSAAMNAIYLTHLKKLNKKESLFTLKQIIKTLAIIITLISITIIMLKDILINKIFPIISNYKLEFNIMILGFALYGILSFLETYYLSRNNFKFLIVSKIFSFSLLMFFYLAGFIDSLLIAIIALVLSLSAGYLSLLILLKKVN